METVYVKIVNVYGRETIYPVCDKAKLFAKIAGTTTLTMASINCISKLGYCLETMQSNALSLPKGNTNA